MPTTHRIYTRGKSAWLDQRYRGCRARLPAPATKREQARTAARIRELIDCKCDRTPIPAGLKKWLAANRKAAEVLAHAKIVPADSARTGDITLADWVDEVLENRVGPTGQRWRRTTVQAYTTPLNRFRDRIGDDTYLHEVTQSDASSYMTWFRKRKPPAATYNHELRHLKGAFEVALKLQRYIHENPFDGLRGDRVPETTNRYVTPHEFKKLIDAANDARWRLLIALAYTGGLRLGEASHLSWADVDFEADTVTVAAKRDVAGVTWQPKNTKKRTIPAPPRTMTLLADRLIVASANNPFVMISDKRLATMQRTTREDPEVFGNRSRLWGGLIKRAGVKCTIHDLRRSCITNWAKTLPIHVVQELAGHTNMTTTQKYYLSVQPSDMDAARKAIERVLNGE